MKNKVLVKLTQLALLRAVLFLIILFPNIVAEAAPLSQGSYTISGAVRDAGYHGLGGVKVEVQQGNQVVQTTYTDAAGIYMATGIAPGSYHLAFSKEGYHTPEDIPYVTITNRNHQQDWRMAAHISAHKYRYINQTGGDKAVYYPGECFPATLTLRNEGQARWYRDGITGDEQFAEYHGSMRLGAYAANNPPNHHPDNSFHDLNQADGQAKSWLNVYRIRLLPQAISKTWVESGEEVTFSFSLCVPDSPAYRATLPKTEFIRVRPMVEFVGWMDDIGGVIEIGGGIVWQIEVANRPDSKTYHTIQGVVRDEGYVGVANVNVTLRDVQTDQVVATAETASSDSELGKYQFAGIVSGEYTLSFEKAGYKSAAKNVEVISNTIVDYDPFLAELNAYSYEYVSHTLEKKLLDSDRCIEATLTVTNNGSVRWHPGGTTYQGEVGYGRLTLAYATDNSGVPMETRFHDRNRSDGQPITWLDKSRVPLNSANSNQPWIEPQEQVTFIFDFCLPTDLEDGRYDVRLRPHVQGIGWVPEHSNSTDIFWRLNYNRKIPMPNSPLSPPETGTMEDRLGIAAHIQRFIFGNDWDVLSIPNAIKEYVLEDGLNAGWFREALTCRGSLDDSRSDQNGNGRDDDEEVIDAVRANGGNVLILLSITTMEECNLDQWYAYAKAAFERYPDVEYWEIINEPSLPNGTIRRLDEPYLESVNIYLDYLRKAHEAADDVGNSTAKFVVGNTAHVPTDWLPDFATKVRQEPFYSSRVIGIGFHPYQSGTPKNTDGTLIHPYAPCEHLVKYNEEGQIADFCYNWNVGFMYTEQLKGDVQRVKDLFPEKELWITEIGWSSDDDRLQTADEITVAQRRQANALVKAFAILMSESNSRAFWYMIKNEANEDSIEAHFGLSNWKNDDGLNYIIDQHKPAYYAFRHFQDTLNYSQPYPTFAEDSLAQLAEHDIHVIPFDENGLKRFVIWSETWATPLEKLPSSLKELSGVRVDTCPNADNGDCLHIEGLKQFEVQFALHEDIDPLRDAKPMVDTNQDNLLAIPLHTLRQADEHSSRPIYLIEQDDSASASLSGLTEKFEAQQTNQLHFTAQGNIVSIADTFAGVAVYNPNTTEKIIYTSENSGLLSNQINGLATTTDGQVLVATDSGVSIFSDSTWETINTVDGLPTKEIKGIAVASSGGYWLAMAQGLVNYNDNNTQLYTKANGLPDGDILAVTSDKSQGGVWLITANQAVGHFHDGTWTALTNLPSENINSFVVVNGGLYLGTEEGLLKYSDDELTEILPEVKIDFVTTDTDGHIWAISEGGQIVQTRQTRAKSISIGIYSPAESRWLVPLIEGITIINQTDPANVNALFNFTGDLGKFSLLPNGLRTFSDLIVGQYHLAVDRPSLPNQFWQLVSVTCQDNYGNSVPTNSSLYDFTTEIPLAVGQHLTCTILFNQANYSEPRDNYIVLLPLIQ